MQLVSTGHQQVARCRIPFNCINYGCVALDDRIEGSVRRSGDKVRVTAQLVRTKDDVQIWSETYDRNLNDIIKIQEELSLSIVHSLEVVIDPETLKSMLSTGTNSVEAYELFLKAQSYRNPNQQKNAIELLELAIKIDPNYARAYEALGVIWLLSLDISLAGSESFSNRDEKLTKGFSRRQFQKNPLACKN